MRLLTLAKSPISIRLLSVAFGFLSSVLINRSLGLDLRGEYTLITTYANLIQVVANLGLCYAYSPLAKRYGIKKAERALVSVIWLQAIIYIFVFCVLGCFVDVTGKWSLALSLLLIINNQIVFVSLLNDIRFRNASLLFSSILYLIFNVVILLLLPGSLFSVLICLCIKTAFESVVLCAKEKLFFIDLRNINKQIIFDVLRYGIPTAVLATLIQVNYNVDVYVLNFFKLDGSQLGIFGVAYSLANMLWFIPDAFKELVYNKSARKHAEYETLSLIVVNISICIVICIAFFFVGRLFLVLAFGEEYGVAFPTVMTVFIGILPMVAFKLIHPIYVNEGRSLVVVGLLAVSIGVNIMIAMFAVPYAGAFGAAIATVMSYGVCGLMFLWKFIHDYKLTGAGVRKELQRMLKKLRS